MARRTLALTVAPSTSEEQALLLEALLRARLQEALLRAMLLEAPP